MTDAQRLKYVINESLKTANLFSKEIGLSQPTRIYHVLKGRNKLSAKLVNIIITKYNKLNPKWLLFEEGSVYSDGHMSIHDKHPEYELSDEKLNLVADLPNKYTDADIIKKLNELEAENSKLKDELIKAKDKIIELTEKLNPPK